MNAMAIQICPTDIIAAPPERIWELLINPEAVARWAGAKVLEAPDHPLAVGERFVLRPAPGLRVSFLIRGMKPAEQLALEVALPFGVVNDELVQITPLEGGRARVTFN